VIYSNIPYFIGRQGGSHEITRGFSASTTISRFDYQVNWNVIMEDGGFMVDKDVKITIDVEADLSE
jgi:polyisoprenoid-binding protein YceI